MHGTISRSTFRPPTDPSKWRIEHKIDFFEILTASGTEMSAIKDAMEANAESVKDQFR